MEPLSTGWHFWLVNSVLVSTLPIFKGFTMSGKVCLRHFPLCLVPLPPPQPDSSAPPQTTPIRPCHTHCKIFQHYSLWNHQSTNLPSGEALVRQMLFGQQYFETRFGKRCETAWLPDTFGLSGSLPQLRLLIRSAGMQSWILNTVFNLLLRNVLFLRKNIMVHC